MDECTGSGDTGVPGHGGLFAGDLGSGADSAVVEAVMGVDTMFRTFLAVPGAQGLAGAADAAMAGLYQALMCLVARPETLDVTGEHQGVATMLVTSYLDRSAHHEFLAEVLAGFDVRASSDPEFRVGVVAALVQLCGDALVTGVAATLPADVVDRVDDETLWQACRSLLSRLALVRCVSAVPGCPD
jgi:hypothetical protein